jgi:hypothetical protein
MTTKKVPAVSAGTFVFAGCFALFQRKILVLMNKYQFACHPRLAEQAKPAANLVNAWRECGRGGVTIGKKA